MYAPLPLAHSVALKEEYNNLEILLQKLNYSIHKWQICGDFIVYYVPRRQMRVITRRAKMLAGD